MTTQELQFELMKKASFNDFDGKRVVKSLLDNQDLWRGAIIDRDDLIKLRDIYDDHWNADTLYIIPKPGKEDELEELAQRWSADEIDFLGDAEASNVLGYYSSSSPMRVLRVWWD